MHEVFLCIFTMFQREKEKESFGQFTNTNRSTLRPQIEAHEHKQK